MKAYYNEIDPYAAQWLRNLIAAGHIAPGDVDERDIQEVRAEDLAGYAQCHFFAGIGVWSYALRLVGWLDERPVWTGSCPCQPFSAAGKANGAADPRHLWPAWFRLIRERKPVAVFGEQVASRDGLAWLDLVHADLEAAGYAVGAIDLCAAGFGAPHIRQRLYFVADATARTSARERGVLAKNPESKENEGAEPSHRRTVGGMGDTGRAGLQEQRGERGTPSGKAGAGEGQATIRAGTPIESVEHTESEQMGISRCAREPRATNGFWADAEWLHCVDGKARPTQPGLFPLAHGATARVGRLRAYGNCIVAPQAAEFIRAYMSLSVSASEL